MIFVCVFLEIYVVLECGVRIQVVSGVGAVCGYFFEFVGEGLVLGEANFGVNIEKCGTCENEWILVHFFFRLSGCK